MMVRGGRTGPKIRRPRERGEKPELLLVTAVLTTSAALGSVSEAFNVHENSHHDTGISTADLRPGGLDIVGINIVGINIAGAEIAHLNIAGLALISSPRASNTASTTVPAKVTVTVPTTASTSAVPALSVPDAPPAPFIGPVADPTEFVQGTQFLQELSLQPLQGIGSYVRSHGAVVTQLLANPPAPTLVTSWWSTLDLRVRNELRSASPNLVGNLDGIPYPIRNLANRALLAGTIAQLQSTIKGESGRTVIENAKVQLKMLQSISDALGDSSANPRRSLMTLDVTGQGRAAIVLGNLGTARYVSYLVPGMFFTIENQMGDWVDAAGNLYDEQLSWLALLDKDAASQSVATVAWIGYHTPNLTNVGGIENADEGRDSLANAIEGLQSIRKGNEPYTTIIAHSYGSTAALMALTEYDFHVDALALVGSPGSPAKSVKDLHVTPGHVWVGEAAWDPIPNSSYFGSDPGSATYGAKPMGVGGGLDSLTDVALLASTGHNEYFSACTESMRNFALIAINQGQFVTAATAR